MRLRQMIENNRLKSFIAKSSENLDLLLLKQGMKQRHLFCLDRGILQDVCLETLLNKI